MRTKTITLVEANLLFTVHAVVSDTLPQERPSCEHSVPQVWPGALEDEGAWVAEKQPQEMNILPFETEELKAARLRGGTEEIHWSAQC